MKSKKYVISILVILSVLNNLNYCLGKENDFTISSKACILIENSTRRVLYEKNSKEKLKIASLTKLMTGIIAVENCKMDDIVTVSKNAVKVCESKLGINEGDNIKLENLLYAMFLKSANDAAIAVAEHISGSIEEFAKLMNSKAKEIGMKNTNFSNPHGLDTDENFSTAEDVSIMLSYALNLSEISKILNTQSVTLKFGNGEKFLSNTNKLLFSYSGCDAGKTGYTNIANRCLTVTAKRNDMRLIAVILGAETTDIRFNEARKLLNYGFENYKLKDISEYMNWYIDIPIIKGNNASYKKYIKDNMVIPLCEGEIEKIYVKQDLVHLIYAPLKKGAYIGNIRMYIENEMIYEHKEYLKQDILKNNILDYFKKCIKNRFNIFENNNI